MLRVGARAEHLALDGMLKRSERDHTCRGTGGHAATTAPRTKATTATSATASVHGRQLTAKKKTHVTRRLAGGRLRGLRGEVLAELLAEREVLVEDLGIKECRLVDCAHRCSIDDWVSGFTYAF